MKFGNDNDDIDWRAEYESKNEDVLEWLKTQDAKVVRTAVDDMLREVNMGAILAVIMLGRRPSLKADGTVSRLADGVAEIPDLIENRFEEACSAVSFDTAFGRYPTQAEYDRLLQCKLAFFEDAKMPGDGMQVATPPSGAWPSESITGGGLRDEFNFVTPGAAGNGDGPAVTVNDLIRQQNKRFLESNIDRVLANMVIGALSVTIALGCRPTKLPESVYNATLDMAITEPELISVRFIQASRIIVFYTVFGRLPTAGEDRRVRSSFMRMAMDEIRKAEPGWPCI